eukprot:522888_1
MDRAQANSLAMALFAMYMLFINTITANPAVDYIWIYNHSSPNNSIGYAHMATIAACNTLNNVPTIAVAWQASSGIEGENDQHIMMSTSTDYGLTWNEPTTVVNNPNYASWGPAFMYEPNEQKLWLFYSASGSFNARSPTRSWFGGNIMFKTSDNCGKTWNESNEILSYFSNHPIWNNGTERGNISHIVANPAIIINIFENNVNKTRIILPYWSEWHNLNETLRWAGSAVAVSDNFGKTWNFTGEQTNNDTWLLEPAVAQMSNGNILQFYRTDVGLIYQSISSDNGMTWSNATPTSLPNPNAKVDIFTDSYNQTILACNPTTNVHNRNPLSLSYSNDNAKTWNEFVILDTYNCTQFHPSNCSNVQPPADPPYGLGYPTSIEIDINGNKLIYTVYSDDWSVGIKLAITSCIIHR